MIMVDKNDSKNEKSAVDIYYKKISRFTEYYVITCFFIITIFPLFEYSWIPGFIKFIYFTGFPLLILLILVSMVKEPFLNFLKHLTN
jgi:hypothetical protein